MSNGEDRIVKVTITIEDSEMVRTIEIPRAHDIDIHYAPQPVSLDDRPLRHAEMMSGWDIRGMADFDYASKRMLITSTHPKIKQDVTVEEAVEHLAKSKVIINRWQWDQVSDALIGSVPSHINVWMDERFKIKYAPNCTCRCDIRPLYIFFGYKQELTKWRLANDIAVKDTFLARDWRKMEGLIARPIPVYDWGWMRNNVKHEIVLRAREGIYRLESMYGSGPELYRSYDE